MQASNARLVVELGGSDRGIDNGDNVAVGCKLLLITGDSMFSADLLAA
jgi:hypothetical protein